MNYVEHFNLFGIDAKQIPCITDAEIPTHSTEGAVGCLYMDTSTGDMYKCTAADTVSEWYEWSNICPIDYIIAKGTNWEKWSSGKAVYYFKDYYNIGGVFCEPRIVGNSVEFDGFMPISFPFTFAEVPHVFCSSMSAITPTCYVTDVTTSRAEIHFVSHDVDGSELLWEDNDSVEFSVYVVGKWK